MICDVGTSFFSDLPDHPLKPLIAKVSSRTVSYISSGPQRQIVQPPPTLPKPPLYIQPSSYSQPPPTYPKPFAQSSQSSSRPQGFSQSLPKPYPHTAPQPQPKPQAPPQTAPKPQSFPQPLNKLQCPQPDHPEDGSRNSVHSGDLLSPTDSGDQLSDGMSAKQMSIKER